MSATDTIVARATPAGSGGVAVVRLSGPEVPGIARTLSGRVLEARRATLCRFAAANGELIDEGLALLFPAPHSYTGEHVLELQVHGSPIIVNQLIARCLGLGARLARPGEFTERAFINGRMDLSQAEAVADLIASTTDTAARAAQRSLQGEFSARVNALVRSLTDLRVYVESAIDFPDEEIDFLAQGDVMHRLQVMLEAMDHLRRQAGQGVILRDGLNLVLAGRPNAGKSSLLNRLAGTDAAIVTDQPGTTRDVLREHLDVDGLPLHIFDTAGLREGGDAIEREGMRRTRRQMEQADHILLLIDASQPARPALGEMPEGVGVTEIYNKIDLTGDAAGVTDADTRGTRRIYLSALSGKGLPQLVAHLKEIAGLMQSGEGTYSARQRHLDAIEEALVHVRRGAGELRETASGELLAEELRFAQAALGRITGEVSADDLLGEIFSSFCIGK